MCAPVAELRYGAMTLVGARDREAPLYGYWGGGAGK